MKHKCRLAPSEAIRAGTKWTVKPALLVDLDPNDFKTSSWAPDPVNLENDIEVVTKPAKVQKCPYCGVVMIE